MTEEAWTTKKVYLAAPFFNREQLDIVEQIEDVFDAAPRDLFELYSPRHDGVLMEMSPEERKANSRRIYDNNVNNVFDAQMMVAVIDGKDAGTVFEMGCAFAKHIPIVAYSNEKKAVNIMLRHSCIAVVRSPLMLKFLLRDWRNTESLDWAAKATDYQKWDEENVT